jgi:iron complex outermembrane receptor protein
MYDAPIESSRLLNARRTAPGVPSVASVILVAAATAFATDGVAQTQNGSSSITALKALSLDDLMNVAVTSVSKAPQALSDAPAAIYVVTRDDILRAGARTIPDMLRLAPNLQVAQITASNFAVTARGFNGSAASKLLVLIDGRSVYTPFHSGVDWAVQDVVPENIERIEVISGPGAALWGANAVNGVINIITREASDTQGGSLNAGSGNLEDRGTVQYGGKRGQDFSYRAYVDSYRHGNDITARGANGRDGLKQTQGGFRTDYAPAGDRLTVQGDFYQGSENQLSGPNKATSGDNLLARWHHELPGGSALQIQTYYDYVAFTNPGAASDYLNTYDLDIQHSFPWGGRQNIVWGGGYRLQQDNFPIVLSGTQLAHFSPTNRTLYLGNVFFQDSIAVTDTLKLVLGTKLEDDTYSGFEPLPNVRLAWNITNADTAWAAISRAVREPSRIDRDLFVGAGAASVIRGGDFQPERLIAYELGYRAQISAKASISISTFYNVYTDLRSAEPASPARLFPIEFANLMSGDTDGVEVWGNYAVNTWWRLAAGANWLHEKLHFDPGSRHLTSNAIAGDDPSYQASLRSTMDLTHHWALNLDLRRIGALPDPASPAYTELAVHLGWTPLPTLEFSLTGSNLIHPQHLEFGTVTAPLQLGASGVETRRSGFANIRWSF